ncbi:MAG: hypothetical protein GY759_09200 [Chloroflexi bacterium]|nr:hypothetical protein [Chloroflexota bacterium]
MDTLLGIDLGTTGIKAAVCSSEGLLLGESYVEYPLITPSAGVVEQDARLWWTLTCAVVRQALAASPAHASQVRALAISSQGISFVPVDEKGRPLRNAINWLDTRATDEIEAVRQRFSDEALFRMTGKRASPSYVLPKLMWLRDHEPELYDRTHKFLMAQDYVLFQLSGQFVTDHSMAGGTLLYDLTREAWSPELLHAFGIDPRRLPEIRWSGSSMGAIRAEVASELGLSQDTVVAVGGQDQKCAALGANIRAGVATVSLGTASAISCIVDRPTLDPDRRIPTFPFVVQGYWDIEGVVGTAGGALRWLHDVLFPNTSFTQLDDMAAGSPAGANGVFFYPHLSGAGSPHWRADLTGAFLGLTLAAAPGDIVRSVLEGVAFQIRENVEAMESFEVPVRELILFGGGARSAIWSQIIADITNRPAQVVEMVDVANWGAILLAGAAASILDIDMTGGARRGGHGTIYRPSAQAASHYDAIYQRYRRQEETLLRK